ncbi:hypothetical protein TELCIR_14283, partial [Teladorsagia circumcincta]
VVNPNHCIEEWIDDRVDVIFYERWYDGDFMFHLMKSNDLSARPSIFTKMADLESCGVGVNGWHWNLTKRTSIEDVNNYLVAQHSLECYLKSVNYTLLVIDMDNDERTKNICSRHKDIMFKRHCIAAEYLQDTDWMLVKDADIGVVNPNHCIEEWIDDRVDVIFYERFFNWEIAASSFMIRNSEFGRNFLKSWADREFTLHKRWHGSDNGVLHLHVIDTVLPDAVQERANCYTEWYNATSYETYMAVVSCAKQAIGATRLWPGKLRIYRRAHGWARDYFLAGNRWYDGDFMFHLMKSNNISAEPNIFTKLPDLKSCGVGLNGWHWDLTKRTDLEDVKELVALLEQDEARVFPKEGKQVFWLTMSDIGECYPDCGKDT